MTNNEVTNLANEESANYDTVTLKWSEVLESAFDYYYTEYIPAWTLNPTQLNNPGDKLFISKKSKEWVSWEKIHNSDRPDIATLFDLLPDLPEDETYWRLIKELGNEGVKEPEDHFWENLFSYKSVNEIEIEGKKYRIEWEA